MSLGTRLFAVVDDIFCLFQGHVENVAPLKQQYGLSKTANEVIIVIEAYRTLRDRGPYPADQVVRDLQGKFAFILYDSTNKSTFVAAVSKFMEVPILIPYYYFTRGLWLLYVHYRMLMGVFPFFGELIQKSIWCSPMMLKQ